MSGFLTQMDGPTKGLHNELTHTAFGVDVIDTHNPGESSEESQQLCSNYLFFLD